jgi:hypothetical protein
VTEKKIFKNKKIAGRELEGKFCLINPENSELIVMNETGTLIWKSIETSHTIKELTDIIFDQYDSTKSEIENDILSFLKKLEKTGMVEVK